MAELCEMITIGRSAVCYSESDSSRLNIFIDSMVQIYGFETFASKLCSVETVGDDRSGYHVITKDLLPT